MVDTWAIFWKLYKQVFKYITTGNRTAFSF